MGKHLVSDWREVDILAGPERIGRRDWHEKEEAGQKMAQCRNFHGRGYDRFLIVMLLMAMFTKVVTTPSAFEPFQVND